MRYSFSNEEFTNFSNLFKDKILHIFSNESANMQKFVRFFFNYIPLDYMQEENINQIASFARESFDFFETRSEKSKRVKVSRHEKNDENYTSIILLVNDMPFIIDSVKNLFAKSNLEINFLFHPTMYVQRDSGGKLLFLEESSNSQKESLVYINVAGILDDYIIEKIRSSIISAFDCIEVVFNAHDEMIEEMHNVAKHLNICPVGYECGEIYEFANWIKDSRFSFVSYFRFQHSSDKILLEKVLGLDEPAKSEKFAMNDLVLSGFANKKELAIFGKLNYLSPMHHGSYMDYILIKDIDDSGRVIAGHLFLGVYDESIHYKSARSIPIIRKKMDYVLLNSPFKNKGYNYKKLVNIIESLPRELLFRIPESELYLYVMSILSALITKKLSLVINNSDFEGFTNCLIFLPANRLTPESHESVSQYLSIRLNRPLITSYYDFIGTDYGYIYLMLEGGKEFQISVKELENEINLMTCSWYDAFRDELIRRYGRREGIRSFKNYSPIFSKEYKDKFFANDAIDDLEIISKVETTKKLAFNLINREHNQILKIYYPHKKLSLSEIMPFIENLGFKVIDEQTFYIASGKYNSELWVHSFNIKHDQISENDFDHKKVNIENALNSMYDGDLANDSLCKLVVLADMPGWKVSIMRALTRYLHQTGFIYGKGYVQLVLVDHYEYSSQLVDLFESRFDPEFHSKDKANKSRRFLTRYLVSVKSSAEDKVLRAMHAIVEAISRTNFYQRDYENNIKKYISFKFDSKKVPNLPMPVPYAEIFVYSKEFEGLHLRGGKVARGGLRWSDRGEDYRTEALGLMKAQMTKNPVIVPVGSKGAFFVKIDSHNLPKTEYREKVVECYKNFLRGLLDITDNIIDHKIFSPNNLISYDAQDPYLVVAADKGTATFSDYANEVSSEYDFWLGDAFASGGSAGYDHKKMAITARGGWIAVDRHFREKGIDVSKDPIKVIAIGDMSGDVFGNGMLLSKAIKLVAAFNHMHIFIDPTPSAEESFLERQRLFNLPTSSWTDYDSKLISEGGGIFERSSKSIKLSQEIKQLLDIVKDEVAPEELISAILKSKVDLLWNGGIGTYIKSSAENNIDIGDKTNDAVRVNANELRVKVIGEGGNLGVSQLGRIEFAKLGGRINTDFIDNSAGVDCSDHEVNIKIALSIAEKSGKLSREDRDILLAEMREEVAELVLADNKNQTLAISFMQSSPALQTEAFGPLIEELERNAGLKRKVEFLPSSTEIAKLSLAGDHLTRPELAVILSYSKMLVKQYLEKAKLTDEPFLDKRLLEYFPKTLRSKFETEILAHPLKHEIIITSITNEIINRMSGVVIHDIATETGAKTCDIVRSYIVISEIFDVDDAWKKIDNLSIPNALKMELYTEINKLLRRGVSWFLRNFVGKIEITNLIKKYKSSALLVSYNIDKFLTGDIKEKFDIKLQKYLDANVPNDIAELIGKLDVLISALDITSLAEKEHVDHFKIAKSYFEIGELFHLDYLRKICETLLTSAYWNRLAIQSLKDDLYHNQCRLTAVLKNIDDIKLWISENSEKIRIYNEFLAGLKSREDVNLNMVILALKKLELSLQML
jgi:glutamate dehydrogenase